jgi:DNA invertase Pin-like site-specific DNA recombinase
MLREVDLFLPSVRKILVPFAKQLPSPPGGHPRKIPQEEEPRVREEVARWFTDGYSLPDAKKKVARSRDASVSTIQRILRKGTIEMVNPKPIAD